VISSAPSCSATIRACRPQVPKLPRRLVAFQSVTCIIEFAQNLPRITASPF